MPADNGISISTKIIKNISIGCKETSFIKALVLGILLPQNAILKGVITVANAVEKADIAIDNAAFPLACCVIKLEMFPPGQAATNIIPSATLGGGLINKITKKANAGKSKN